MTNRILILIISVVLFHSITAHAFTIFEDSGKGEIVEDKIGGFNGVPLLDGFRFQFGSSLNESSGIDQAVNYQ